MNEFLIIDASLLLSGCVKGKKIEGLDVCDKVEIWRFKMI